MVTYIRDQLRRRLRTGLGRCPYPVTLIIDSQSVKGASTVSRATRGFDPAKLINGRKRHVAVDTKGFPMIMVTPADMQDRDAARELLWRLRLTHPQITQAWADSAYAGQLVTWAEDFLHITLKTVSRPKGAKGFVVLPRRWRVERTLGWIMNARRNARDYERLPQHSEAHLNWSLITPHDQATDPEEASPRLGEEAESHGLRRPTRTHQDHRGSGQEPVRPPSLSRRTGWRSCPCSCRANC